MDMIDRPVTGTFSATGVSASVSPNILTNHANVGSFNVWLDFTTGAATGSVKLQRSPDNGATWYDLVAGGTTLYVYTASGSTTVQEVQNGVVYRLNCTALSAGTINYRIG